MLVSSSKNASHKDYPSEASLNEGITYPAVGPRRLEEKAMRYELKSMGLWAFLKVSFFLNLIGGFLFGFFYAVLLMFSTGLLASLGLPREELMLFEEGGGIGLMFIILPIMFSLMAAALYTLAGVIFVLLYNVIARLVGGFEVDLQPVDMTPVPTGESGPMYAQTAPAAPHPRSYRVARHHPRTGSRRRNRPSAIGKTT